MFCLLQKNRKKHRLFLAFKRAGEFPCEGWQARKVQVYNQTTTTNHRSRRERSGTPAWAWKNKNKKNPTRNKQTKKQTSFFQSNGSVREAGRGGGACGQRVVFVRGCVHAAGTLTTLFRRGGITGQRMERRLPFCEPAQVQTVIRDGTSVWPHASTTQWHLKSNRTRLAQTSTLALYFFLLILLPKPIVVRM